MIPSILSNTDPADDPICGLHSVPRVHCCPDRVTPADLANIVKDLRDDLLSDTEWRSTHEPLAQEIERLVVEHAERLARMDGEHKADYEALIISQARLNVVRRPAPLSVGTGMGGALLKLARAQSI